MRIREITILTHLLIHGFERIFLFLIVSFVLMASITNFTLFFRFARFLQNPFLSVLQFN